MYEMLPLSLVLHAGKARKRAVHVCARPESVWLNRRLCYCWFVRSQEEGRGGKLFPSKNDNAKTAGRYNMWLSVWGAKNRTSVPKDLQLQSSRKIQEKKKVSRRVFFLHDGRTDMCGVHQEKRKQTKTMSGLCQLYHSKWANECHVEASCQLVPEVFQLEVSAAQMLCTRA